MRKLIDRLSNTYVERQEVVEALVACVVARRHAVLVGPPGTAKSCLIRDLAAGLGDLRFFSWLLTEFSVPEELFGPLDVAALERGRYRRITTHKLPEAEIAFVDEVFKAGPAILNTFLSIMQERLFYDDGQPTQVPLVSLIGASNEVPTGEQALEALWDRFTVRLQDSYIDMIKMGARWYDPKLARWASADTIVPDFANPQSLNRFSYVLGNPLRYVDPSGHDPLDENWQREFEAAHGYAPGRQDRLIRLFSIAFLDEWIGEYGNSFFYNEDGTYRKGSMELAFKRNIPADRTWAIVPDALERLAGWYMGGETKLFVRDIGTLFGGLPDRFDVPSMHIAVTGCEKGYSCDNAIQLPAQIWVGVDAEGLSPDFTGTSDWDANMHHWAWALVLGYYKGGAAGMAMNTVREHRQAGVDPYEDVNASADIWIGNRGALMGADMRWSGHSRGWVRKLFRMYMLAD